MTQQTQVKKTSTKKASEPAPAEIKKETKAEQHDKKVAEIDDLLDEIESVLEDESFAVNFKQMGGE